MSTQPIVILLAEDDEGHATLIQRNLKRAGIVNEVVHVRDGQAALDYIRCEGAYRSRTLGGPLLLLLDINMPLVDGIEVLRQIKGHEKTAKLPVVMLTTTDNPQEVARCYQLGCGVYVTKPVVYEDFVEAVKRLGLFLSVVNVPPEKD